MSTDPLRESFDEQREQARELLDDSDTRAFWMQAIDPVNSGNGIYLSGYDGEVLDRSDALTATEAMLAQHVAAVASRSTLSARDLALRIAGAVEAIDDQTDHGLATHPNLGDSRDSGNGGGFR